MEADHSQALFGFALDIYKQAYLVSNSRDGNAFCSPFSIAAALGMTLAGARGNTSKEIVRALHQDDDSAFHKHLSHLRESFKSLVPDIALHVANRMYCEKTFQPLEAYFALLKESYSTTVESVNFRGNAEAVRQQINVWVEDVTRGKIKDLLPQGVVTAATVVMLVNAVYFKGVWYRQFDPSLTRPMNFHGSSSAVTTVDMMYREGDFKVGYSEGLKATALEIPYKGERTSMVILLPDETEGLRHVENALTVENFSSLLVKMDSESGVQVYLPKFKVEQGMDLKKVLQQLGVQDLFTSNADLSGICAKGQLMVSDAIHKAFVEVNEEGTEAAAATAVAVMFCSMPIMNNRIFKADHPFMFFILAHDPTVVLFVGHVKSPKY